MAGVLVPVFIILVAVLVCYRYRKAIKEKLKNCKRTLTEETSQRQRGQFCALICENVFIYLLFIYCLDTISRPNASPFERKELANMDNRIDEVEGNVEDMKDGLQNVSGRLHVIERRLDLEQNEYSKETAL